LNFLSVLFCPFVGVDLVVDLCHHFKGRSQTIVIRVAVCYFSGDGKVERRGEERRGEERRGERREERGGEERGEE